MDSNRKRPAFRTEDTSFDRILDSFLSEDAEKRLTPHELTVRDRYLGVAAIADLGYPDNKVIRIHMKKTGVSKSTAYRDLREGQEILGEVNKTTRQAKRYALEQLAKKGLRLAIKYEDARAYAALIRAIGQFQGLDKDDTTAPDPQQFIPPSFIIQVGAGNGTTSSIDISKLGEVSDVEYELVTNAVETTALSIGQMDGFLDELEKERK